MHSVPPYLYKPETIQRFQGRLREAFLGGDRGTARVYLQNLVDHIVVGEDEIIIEARAGAALAMMSASGTSSPEAAKGEVLAHVVDWRPNGDGSKNLRLVVSNPAKRPERPPPLEPKPPELPRIVGLLALARKWQAQVDRGEIRTRAELAARSGLHPYRVSNILCLLRLHPAILTHVAGLVAGTPNDLNERWLRPIARLPHSEQLAAVARRLGVGTASLLSQEGCG